MNENHIAKRITIRELGYTVEGFTDEELEERLKTLLRVVRRKRSADQYSKKIGMVQQ